MSWSVKQEGKSDEVAVALVKEFERIDTYLSEPEKAVAQKAAALIAESLAGNQPPCKVLVQGWGSQTKVPERQYNAVHVDITVYPNE